ncbi:MAG: hypothetical protein Q9160_007431 [Pyrenula sp. 1 TL-2023]
MSSYNRKWSQANSSAFQCGLLTSSKWLFQSKETRRKSNGENGEQYVIRSRAEFAANTLLTLIIPSLLVMMVYLLFDLTNRASQTAIPAVKAGGADESL